MPFDSLAATQKLQSKGIDKEHAAAIVETCVAAANAGRENLATKADLKALEQSTAARFEKLENSIDARFEKLEDSVDARFEKFENWVKAKFEMLENSIKFEFEKRDLATKTEFEKHKVQMITWMFGMIFSASAIIIAAMRFLA